MQAAAGVNPSPYNFVATYATDNTSLITGLSRAGIGGIPDPYTSGTVHTNFGYGAYSVGTFIHEIGHNMGLGHARSLKVDASIPPYIYDYATNAYVASPGLGAQPILGVPIGIVTNEYANPDSALGAGSGLTPREKTFAGWIDPSSLKNINALPPAVGGNVVKIYDDMTGRSVVTNGGVGANLKYGVDQTYNDSVSYGAYLVRPADTFHITGSGVTATGKWLAYTQTLDFYYRSNQAAYPGFDAPPTSSPGIAITLGGMYLGALSLGETFLEKNIAQSLFIPIKGGGNGGAVAGANQDDGSKIDLGTPTDITSYPANAPLNPNRYRSIWYEFTYESNSSDANGSWANLKVQSFTGAQIYGLQWDASTGPVGAQDGGGTWNASALNWRKISTSLDNQLWAESTDAVFGANSGAAGTVTLGGNITAKSIAFKQTGSGAYTIAGNGNTLTIDVGGVNAEVSATLATRVALNEQQLWSVSAGATLDTTGVIVSGADTALYKMGQGTLKLGGVNTWTSQLRVTEGPVLQVANQTFNAGIIISEAGTYRVSGGTLAIAAGKNIHGMFSNPFETDRTISYISYGLLDLVTGSTSANPALSFAGDSSVYVDVNVGAGTHYLTGSANTVTVSGTISDTISGSGTLIKQGGGTLKLTGANTFSGNITVNGGRLAVDSYIARNGAYSVTVNSGGAFSLGDAINGLTATIGSLSGNGGWIDANYDSTAGTRTLGVNQSVDGTFAGVVSDASGGRTIALLKGGAATLLLTGNNPYSCGTTVTQGTLRIGGVASVGTGAINLAGGVLSVDQRQGLTQSSIASAALNTTDAGSGARFTSDFSAITGQGSPGNTNQIFTGKIFLTAGQWSFGEGYDDSAYLKINGQVVLNNGVWFTPTYGSISIANDDWYPIDLRVAKDVGGAISNTEGAWPNTKGIGVKTGEQTANAADYTTFGASAAGIRLSGQNRMPNAVLLTGNATVEILDTDTPGGAETVFTGGVTGTGNLTKSGAGTLTLSGTGNTYSGATFVTAGTFAADNANAFSPNSAVTLSNANGVVLDLGKFDQTIAGLSGGGSTGGNVVLGAGTLTTGGNNAATGFAGVISGTGGLTKTGTGTMTLSGQNTYTGTTRVTGGGTLSLDYSSGVATSGIIAGTSALVLDNSAASVKGRAGATITQTFAGLSVVDGVNRLTLVGNGAANLVVNIGAITRTGAGTIDFAGLTGSVAGARVLTTSGTNGALLDGGAAWATYAGSDWASRDASGYIVAYTGYVNVPTNGGVFPAANTTANVRITEAAGTGTVTLPAGTSTQVGSVLMAAGTTAARIDVAGKTLDTKTVAVAATAKQLSVGTVANQGSLTSSNNALQLISNAASAANGLVVNSAIVNTGLNPLNVSVSGGANAGTTTFAGTNSYTGTTSVTNNGTLRIGAGGTTGRLGNGGIVTLNTGSTLAFDRSDAATVSNVIGGAGKVIQDGTGTTILSGVNTYTGVTQVNRGTLQIGTGTNGALGAATQVNVSAGAKLAFGRTDSATFNNTVTGSGTIVREATGTTILTGDVAGASATITATGTLQLGSVGGTTGTLSVNSINNTGTLAVYRSDSVTIGATIAGVGSLAQLGTGTTILTANNTYSGTTTIAAGTLQVGDGGTTGSLGSGALTNSGTLAYKRSDDFTLSSTMGGTGNFEQRGTNTITLTGNNTYTGTTKVATGTLKVGTGATLGTGALILEPTGTLAIDGTAFVLANTVSGYGQLTWSGTGTLNVTGDGSGRFGSGRFGSTTINSGTLSIDGAGVIGKGTLRSEGAAIVFNSSANQLVSIIEGTGTLNFNGSGRVDVGGYTFTGAVNINAGSVALTSSSTGFNTINVNALGALILSTELKKTEHHKNIVVTGAGVNATTGLYIEDSSIIAADKGLNLTGAATTIRHIGTGRGSIGSLLGGGIIVDASASGSVIDSYIDIGGNTEYTNTTEFIMAVTAGANTATGDLRVDGGLRSGYTNSYNFKVRGTGSVNFTGDSVAYTVFAQARDPNYTPGFKYNKKLSVEDTATMMFTGNASLSEGVFTGTISIADGAKFVWGANTPSQQLAGIISGDGAVVKRGSGALTLTAANTFTGGIFAEAGTLNLNYSAAGAPATDIIAASNWLYLDGGTVVITGKAGQNGVVQTFAGLDVRSGTSTLQLVQNGATTLDVSLGAITGAGSFTKNGSGKLTLSGANTFSGTKTLNAGTIVGTALASLGDIVVNRWSVAAPGVIAATGATAAQLKVMLTAGSTGTLALAGANPDAAPNLTGYADLFLGAIGEQSVGTLDTMTTLTGWNATGGWNLGGGGGTLTMNLKLTGAGALLIGNGSNTGRVHLTNISNDFTGAITVKDGVTLTSSDIRALSSGTIAVAYGSSLGLGSEANATTIFGRVIPASGGVLKLTGADANGYDFTTRALNSAALGADGAATYTGVITPGTGGYKFGGDGALSVTGALTGARNLSADGQGSTGGVTTLSGPNTFTGAITVQGGLLDGVTGAHTLKVGSATALGAAANTLVLNAGGTLELDGRSVTLGGLSGGAGSSLLNSAAGTSTLTVNQAVAATFAGTIAEGTGALNLVKNGAGTLTLSGDNRQTGSVTINAGAIRLGSGTALGATANTVTVVAGGALDLAGNSTANALSIGGAGSGSFGALHNSIQATAARTGALTLSSDAVISGSGTTSQLSPESIHLNGRKLTVTNVRLNTEESLLTTGDIAGGDLSLFYAEEAQTGAGSTGVWTLGALSELTIRNYNNTALAARKSIVLDGGKISNGLTGINNGGGDISTLANNVTVNAGGGEIAANSGWYNNLRFSGTLAGTGALTITGARAAELMGSTTGYTGNINLAGGKINLNGTQNQILTGTIQGNGSLIKSGVTTLTLTGANTYSGGTTVDAGELQSVVSTVAGAKTTFGTGAVTVNANAAVTMKTADTANAMSYANAFNLNGATFTSENAVVTYSGAFAITGTNTVNVVHFGKNATFSNRVRGAGGLTKTGLGTLILTAANTYTGTTAIDAGSLVTRNSKALGDSAAITVATGATLQIGNGTTNSVTLAAGATLAVDGTLKFFAATSQISLAGTGGYDLKAGSILDLNNVFNTVGTYTLITGGTGAKTDGAFSLTGYNLSAVSVNFAQGLLTVTAVPEPATYGLLGAGALATAAIVRRRRKPAKVA